MFSLVVTALPSHFRPPHKKHLFLVADLLAVLCVRQSYDRQFGHALLNLLLCVRSANVSSVKRSKIKHRLVEETGLSVD